MVTIGIRIELLVKLLLSPGLELVKVGCFLGLLTVGFVPAYAANWDLTPSIQVSEVYIDNIGSVPEDELEESEFITQIVPAILARYSGRRFQADIDYRIQSLMYSGDKDRNNTFQQLNASANSEIISDVFFFDLNASRAQQVKDSERPVSLRNIAIQNDVTDVLTVNASPYTRYAFGSAGAILLGYRNGTVDYKENTNALVDSEVNSIYFNIGERVSTRRFNWQLDYTKDDIAFDPLSASEEVVTPVLVPDVQAERENSFEQQYATLIVSLGNKTFWQLVVGEENNEFATRDNQEIDGSYWRTGFQWLGGEANQFELWLGDRFFGNTGSLKWLRTGRYMSFDVKYSEELFTDSQRQLGAEASNGRFGSDVVVSRASSGVYLRSRFDLTLGYSRSNSIISLILFGEDREFQGDGQVIQSSGGSLEWNWRLAPQTRLISSVQRRHDESLVSDREDDLSNVSFAVNRRINSKLSVNLELSHEHLHVSNFGAGYHSNSLLFGIDKAF